MKTTKEYLPTFYAFLREHNALLPFIINLFTSNHLHFKSIDEMCKKLKPHQWLSCTFPWFETNEGFAYWNELAEKWDFNPLLYMELTTPPIIEPPKPSKGYTNDPHLKDLLSFLKEHDALVPFIVNLFTVTPIISIPRYKSIKHWWEITGKDTPISCSFKWAKTTEGFNYWDRLKRAWRYKV